MTDEAIGGLHEAVLSLLAAAMLLLSGGAAGADGSFGAWHVDGDWYTAGDVKVDPYNERHLLGGRGTGALVNGRIGRTRSLVTKRRDYRDVEVHLEFMVAKGSNSGVIFHGNYEIQILDSHHVKQPTAAHCGGIYPRAEAKPKYRYIDEGSPPRVNAAKPPGQWQTLNIIFQSPRFGKDGKKTAHARFVKVVHNGQVIQENVEVPYACGTNWNRKQYPQGPIILQGDYGPVAFRNVRVSDWKGEAKRALNVPPEGFTALFNGKDLTGWRVHPKVKEMWSIEDGVLKSPGLLKEWGADLATQKNYRDFVLMLEFRMPTISDSGINFRRLIPEIPGFGNQEQFNLRSRGGMGHLESYYFLPKATATARGLKEEEKPHVRHIDPKVGVWHRVRITMQGRTITTEFDGEVLLDNFRYHDWMLSMEPAPIRLQKHIVVHGQNLGKENPCPIEYRNIFIKELEPPEQNVPPRGFTALFNGEDLTGWRASPRAKEAWSIEDGVLKSSAPREADLFTEKEYRDFVLMVDYRMPEESDSGIYFRRLAPNMGTFGQREQLNLTAGRGGWMGNLLSFNFLPKELRLSERERPRVRRVTPAIGQWHTIKLTVVGRKVTAECDGEVMIDRFVYPTGLLSMAPGPIGLQKHPPADPSGDGRKSACSIEFRNVFIKEIEPAGQNVPPEGFTALFNGKNFNGWRLSPAVRDAWTIEDGTLRSHKPIKGWGSDLRTVKKYRDFVLMVDYRIPRISDSGIYIRGLMPGIGIFDRDRWEQFNLRSRGGTGTLESFRFQPPDRRVEPPRVRPIDPEVGVWHTVKLTLVGKTLSAEYDGETIIDEYEYADGVLSMEPSVIRLQKHPPCEIGGEMSDCPIEFRNVFIKEIEPSGFPRAIQRPKLNVPPRGFTALFNGEDFTGWQVTPAVKKAWRIEDGVLKAHDEIKEWGADLMTRKKYRDFVLLVDFRFPTVSDSGIWFRGIPGIMGGMEQFNLMSVYGTGNLDSLDHLPRDVQLSFRDAAYTPFFYCQPAYYGLKDPPVRYTDPQVGVWHTVKLTLIGRTLSAEYDGQVMHDRFEYPEGTLSMEPSVIRLQKHVPQRIAGKLCRKCPIEFRNVFIKELKPGDVLVPARPPKTPPKPVSPNAELLARTDRNPLPKAYDPARHQDYVDRRMAGLRDAQKGRISQLWKEKQRIDPKMPNRGYSFVKIMEHLAADVPPELPLWEKPTGRQDVKEQVRFVKARPGSPSGLNRAFSFVSEPTYSIHRPKKPNGVGLVICPGGGFRDVWLDREGHDLAFWLKQHNVTSLVLKYRTRLDNGTITSDAFRKYLSAVRTDGRQAIRILRKRAPELGLKPDEIGICGFSAGGHLALSCAIHPEPKLPRAQVSGMPDFAGLFYPGIPDDIDEAIARRTAPESAAPAICPMFIVNARIDKLTPAAKCVDFYSMLLKAGFNAELHVFGKGSHGFGLGAGRGHSVVAWPNSFLAWLRDTNLIQERD